jgi:hypothetical protein
LSFGPSQAVKNATNTAAGITNTATTNSGGEINSGNANLNTGGSNITSGTNFLNTVLSGNQANTTALLQPNINQIRQANQQTLQGINTLSPRGGGRSGTNYAATSAPNEQIQNLFGNARTTAATALPQIGLAQQGIGTNLVGAGNNALSTATTGANNGIAAQLANQQRSDNLVAGIGKTLMGLALAPVTGGGSVFGNAVGCWIAQAIYGEHDIRTHLVRQWLNMEYAQTRTGRVVMAVYRKIGRQVAPYVRGPIRWMLKPLFDAALRKAEA